ncbi:MAG: ribose ABC transporter permease, partial [Acidobacteria bacterium]
MARQTAVITIIAMGMTVVMVAGGIDLSVGSVMALAGVVGAFAMTNGAPVLEGIAAAVAAGAACGLANGVTIAALRIPPFIVTLGAMGVYRGVALLITDGKAVVGLPQSFGYLAEGNLFGLVPVPLLLVVLVALATHFLLSSTRAGRYCYAIGSNVEAARYAGVRV